MKPSFTKNGFMLALSALAFFIFSVLVNHWLLSALGLLIVSVIFFSYFQLIPLNVFFRGNMLEFAWWIPSAELAHGALSVGQHAPLHLLLRNFSQIASQNARISLVHSSSVDAPESFYLTIAKSNELHLSIDIIPRAAGHIFFHGAKIEVCDPLGIFQLNAYFPNLLALKVFPSFIFGQHYAKNSDRNISHQSGNKRRKRVGLSTDLRELREYRPGDPFKHIAWKHSAKTRGNLLVKEHKSELSISHQILLDISPSMRRGKRGLQKLDLAMLLCGALSKAALDSGDRIGLTCFDTRIVSQVKTSDKKRQILAITEQLLELHTIVDESLTDLTDGELCSIIADYFAHQYGINLRLPSPPPHNDPKWRDLVIGRNGELIDLVSLLHHIRTRINEAPAAPRGLKIEAMSEEFRQIRLFCRLCGIELPYRLPNLNQNKVDGLLDALDVAHRKPRAHQITIITDLLDVDAAESLLKKIAFYQRRGQRFAFAVPMREKKSGHKDPLSYIEEKEIEAIFELHFLQGNKDLRRQINALGIPIIRFSHPTQIPHAVNRLQR